MKFTALDRLMAQTKPTATSAIDKAKPYASKAWNYAKETQATYCSAYSPSQPSTSLTHSTASKKWMATCSSIRTGGRKLPFFPTQAGTYACPSNFLTHVS